MKHWQETEQLLSRLAELRERGEGASLATVVQISGSAYRRPGAKFLIEEEGATLGGVSGGCLEEDVRRIGLGLLGGEECRLLHYDTGSDEDTVWGLGLGCDGEVDVFVQPAGTGPFLEAAEGIRDLLEGQEPIVVCNVVASERLSPGRPVVVAGGAVVAGSTGDPELDERLVDRAGTHLETCESALWHAGEETIFVDALEPPPFLVVCGAGDDAMPLVSMATEAGFRVVVVDHRPAYLEDARFPDAWALRRGRPEDGVSGLPATEDTFVVVKTHNLERDRGWSGRFLETPVPYVGLLGPKSRRDEILDSVEPGERDRIYGPVGLDLGADGPEQVGVSIVSELLAVRSGRRPRHLREREVAIHAEA